MALSAFERRMIRLEPGCVRPYDEAEWEDELVIVVCGTIELEGLSGRRWRFDRGSIVWLTELPLRALHNASSEVAILMAVSRPMNSRTPKSL
jgi:hypothetical protein